MRLSLRWPSPWASSLLVLAAGAAWAAGAAPGAAAAAGGLGAISLLEAARSRWANPAHWPGAVIRRGAHLRRLGLVVEVRAGEAEAALALAAALEKRGLRGSFFLDGGVLAAGGSELVEQLQPQEVGALGALTPSALAQLAGKSGPVRLSRPRWRWAGPTPRELQFARSAGLTLVGTTLELPAEPTGLAGVATDLAALPLSRSAAQVEAWLRDFESRAVEVSAVSDCLSAD